MCYNNYRSTNTEASMKITEIKKIIKDIEKMIIENPSDKIRLETLLTSYKTLLINTRKINNLLKKGE